MDRAALLASLDAAGEPWDLLVVGGGATGLGTAVEAAARGYRTLLAEAGDFAGGTSSRSTKLVHGGVRYLRQGEIGLVLESLRERGRLLRNAPHLVAPLPFVVPAYAPWERPFYGLGLALYDRLAGRRSLGTSRRLSRDETLAHLPTLAPTLAKDGIAGGLAGRLTGGILYHDAQFDDARLALALARTFADLGGAPINYLRAVALVRQSGRVAGAVLRDEESGGERTVYARAVVNAAGVWTDEVRRLDDPASPRLLSPSQGVHLVLNRRFLPGGSALLVPRTDDGRVLFAIPWHGRVVVGTTDTALPGGAAPPREPRALPAEIDFLLAHAGRYLAPRPERGDVLAVFAGLRPLLRARGARGTADLSRDHVIAVSPSGLLTITGGKWTTYRKMGEDAVDRAARAAGLPVCRSRTATLRLHGAPAPGVPPLPIDTAEPWAVYGAEAPALRALAAADPALARPLHPRLPYLAVQVAWAARHEMARTVEDVLARRTRALFLDARAALEAAPAVAALLATERGEDAVWQERQVAAFRAVAAGYLAG
jgi:glycerol-3-phosphate dehydrogenase